MNNGKVILSINGITTVKAINSVILDGIVLKRTDNIAGPEAF
jgi:hypothetical protein